MRDLSDRIAALSPAKRALLARHAGGVRDARAPEHVPRHDGVNVFPASSAQERLWFLEQVESCGALYNVATVLRAVGTLDPTQLRASLDDLVERHESLRTTFDVVDGELVQVVSPQGRAAMSIVDLTTIDAPERVATERAEEESRRPFDLTHGPLLRAHVFRVAPDVSILAVVLHHIVADAWSVGILVRELAARYGARCTVAPSAPPANAANAHDGRHRVIAGMPPLRVQYADFAGWERSRLAETKAALIAYWKRQLDGALPPALSTRIDALEGTPLSFDGGVRRLRFGPALERALREVAKRERVTTFVTLLSAFAILLRRRTGQDDVTIVTPVANREHPDSHTVVGFFVNLVPLRLRLPASSTFADVLRHVRSVVVDAQLHQDLPFEVLLKELRVPRTLLQPTLARVGFAVESDPRDEIRLPGLTLLPLDVETVTSKTDLSLIVSETAGGMTARIEYRRDCFDAPTIDRMLADLEAVLVEVTASEPAAPPAPCDDRRRAIEHVLRDIWRTVLRLDAVALDENFFAIGGDSIMSLRVVAESRRHGIHLTPRHVFEHPTIAGLARIATTAIAPEAEQGIVSGPVELTPIQRMFLDAGLPRPDHYNLSALVELPEAPDPALVATAVERVLRHHDALRMRFVRGAGGWRQTNQGLQGAVPFTCIDLSAIPDVDHRATIESRATALQASLDLAHGPVLRVASFVLGPRLPARLLLVVHHLVCDALSLLIVLEDLLTVYDQLRDGMPIVLPRKTTSFRQWARRLTEYARSVELDAEIPLWRAQSGGGRDALPIDEPGGANTIASARTLTTVVGRDETAALFERARIADAGSVEPWLLTALATAIARWSGARHVGVYVERHGREAIIPGVDVSRTVGWFTAVFPLRLPAAVDGDLRMALEEIRRLLRAVPNGGVGWGVLRSLRDDGGGLGDVATGRPSVSFNYLGMLGEIPARDGVRRARESAGREYGDDGPRPTVLDVTAHVTDGALEIQWLYAAALHHRSTIERLARSFLETLRVLEELDQ